MSPIDFSSLPIAGNLGVFIAAGVVVWVAGHRLAHAVDLIAYRDGPILAATDRSGLLAASIGLVSTCLLLLGLLERRNLRRARDVWRGLVRSLLSAVIRVRIRMLPRLFMCAALASGATGCAGVQSSLAPAGLEAERIATLYWWMTGGALVVWLGVVVLGLYYGRPHPASPSHVRDRWLIVGTGVVFPLTVLTALLAYGLSMLPPLVARAPEGSLIVDVEGEQWWWRVRYVGPGDTAIELANEIRLPVGEPVQFRLHSDNVIHSFWIPSLGGKMDMIPGRVTFLALHPTATGVFAGACAEYCGTAHGFMRFMVQVMERAAFDQWLAGQAAAARAPADALAARGQQVVQQSGCAACHAIRGTDARGQLGPDLTHVASRLSLAAATVPNAPGELERWLAAPERIKPGVHMPAFAMLGDDDLRAMAAYLRGLQ